MNLKFDGETAMARANTESSSIDGVRNGQISSLHKGEFPEKHTLYQNDGWLYHTMFEHATIGIAYAELNGQLVLVNQRYCDIVGYTREELLTRDYRSITHPDDVELNATYLQRVLAGEAQTYGIEKRYIRKDGTVVWAGLSVTVVHAQSSEPTYFIAFIEDITDRKQAEEERNQLLAREQAALAEAAARASQLEATFDALADGIIVYDREGHIQQVNAAAHEVLGVDAQPDYSEHVLEDRVSLLQERLPQFRVLDEQGVPLPKEQWPVFRILNGEMLKGKNAVDIISQALDGREVQLSITGAPVRDTNGQTVGAVAIMRDVTERRQLERRTHEALNALLAMAEALIVPASHADMQALLSEDENTQESHVAKRLAELTRDVLSCQRVGITTVEPETSVLRARAVVGLSPEQEQQWWAEQEQQESRLSDSSDPELVARLRANEVIQLDMTQPPLNTLPNPYGIHYMLIVPMSVGNQLVGILSLDNGGADQEYTSDEMGLAGAVGTLVGLVIERERLLRERAEAHANELALREANRRMDEFLGIACHELKTPLAAIKGNVQLAERRIKRLMDNATIDKMLPDLLENANRQTDRLARLVNDLLDVSRIQAGKLEMRPELYNLLDVVRDVVQAEQLIHPTRSILLELPHQKHVPVLVDADRIGQVVTNYLANALKYSAEISSVRVTLTVEDKVAWLAVRDKGPGIPVEEQKRIWERFHQVEGIEVQSGSGVGLGLGLYISRTIIERHHGMVGVESVPGYGATFWCTLPIVEQSEG
jgi:PAS domain S-box-containing protein